MNRDLIGPVIKLSISTAALIGLLVLSRPSIGGEFRGLAIVTAIIVAGPVTLLLLIDVGRVLSRQTVGTTAKRLSLVPQRMLGGIACLAGAVGVAMSFIGPDQTLMFRILSCLISLGVIASGIVWIRTSRLASKKKDLVNET